MHNVIDQRDTVPDELEQLATSGFDVDHLRAPVAAAVAAGDLGALAVLGVELARAPRRSDWPYEEPSDRRAILAALDWPAAPPRWRGTVDELGDRIYGAWLGRCAGCCVGKPVEGLTPDEVARYLAAANAQPLTGYLPLLDPLPAGVSHLNESAPVATLGRFTMMPRDDDVDWTIRGLYLLETYGTAVDTEDIAWEWLDRLPFTQTYTAERAAYRNLVNGHRPPATATNANPYREWIGALIRADAWGYAYPANPLPAVELAITDARLSHVGNGIYGEMWAAALVSVAFTAPDARAALDISRTWIPPRSRLRAALDRVLELYDSGAPWERAFEVLDGELGHYSWVHTINNAAYIAAALLWGAGDFTSTVELTVRSGGDTDSTGATVGSVFGAMHGPAAIPPQWTEPLAGHIHSALRDFDGSAIADLAARTTQLALGLRTDAV